MGIVDTDATADARSGRERKGRDERRQLESPLCRREDAELPGFDAADPDSELLASPEADPGERRGD